MQSAKNSGTETITALKMPFFVLPAILAVMLILQVALITFCKTRRLLLPQGEHIAAGATSPLPQPLPIAPHVPIADGNS